ncbi:MAG: hypothetical protein KAH72_00945 [Flavobacteriaceae bacterium]|nr:hypothetical protein [Flavobacteriaceae bacterium]
MEPQETAKIIDDYIVDYNNLNNGFELEGILVYVEISNDQLISIEIQDYPLEHLYYDIINRVDSTNSFTIGVYQDIPTKLYGSENTKNSLDSILKYDSSLLRRAREYLENPANDKLSFSSMIDDGLIEYSPVLVSKYVIQKQVKILELINGEIKNVKYIR